MPQIPHEKVMSVRPRPFSTLFKVVFRYKKGQIHASTVMKSPAKGLEKRKFPKKFPKSKKKTLLHICNRVLCFL